MKHIAILFALLIMAAATAGGRERSYSIEFGAATAGTTSLTNQNFMSAVKSGAGYIEAVTSVVAVFPERDAIRMSSQKTGGKFNIHLTKDAQVVATRIVLQARRYENDRDAEASLMLNSETLYIPSPESELYTLAIPSRPEKTLTNLIIDAEHRVYLESITVYYDDANGSVDPVMETVATPVFTPAGGSITAGTEIAISCDTDGATIYYTVDGSAPSTASPQYSTPLPLYHDTVLKAFAVKEGMKPSDIAEGRYSVRNAEATLVSVFDFANPETLVPSVASPAVSEWVDLDGRTFSDGQTALHFAASGSNNTNVRLYGSYDSGTDLRLYDGDMITIQALNPAYTITGVSVTISHSGSDSDAWFTASSGEWVWENDCWQAGEDAVSELMLTSYRQSRITSMTVTLEKGETGLKGIEAGNGSRPVYYNLQGMPVQSPRGGFYIKVENGEADKVIMRSNVTK